MKLFIIAAVAVSTVGCASSSYYGKETQLHVPKRTQPMGRQEVIQAITDCESAMTRPVLIMGKQRINDWDTDIVLNVTCAPMRQAHYK
jgi:hypothetical protein